jgi:hypothetical protein
MNETNSLPTNEKQRQPVDIALSCARTIQSGQTGFLHYCYKSYDDEPAHTIPISENLLFALALLRTRMADSITEAKTIIDKLLHFQNLRNDTNHGNFPIYLHDYPQCRDPLLAAQLLPTCYWILRDYRKVLGSELGAKLQQAVELLLTYILKSVKEGGAPYALEMKIAASAQALGTLFGKKDFENEGIQMLAKLHDQGIVASWYSPSQMGDMLIALEMVVTRYADSPWKNFWDHLNHTWHRKSCSYVGPALEERQKHYEPQSTVYDLFMGHYSGMYSYRSFTVHPYQLQAVLIHHTDEKLPEISYPFAYSSEFEGRKWQIYQTEDYGFSIMQYQMPQNISQEYRVHPLHIVWGSRTRTHSLVSQGGNLQQIDYEILPNGDLEMHFELPAGMSEARENTHDISFFIDMHDGLEKSVVGKKATTFQIRDDVTLKSEDMKFLLKFDHNDQADEEGNRFFGHIMPGNRPAQMGLKAQNRFKAFDYQIFLRAVERKTPCHIIARITMKKGTGLWT